jgi:ATP-binding cassette subfamily B protein
MGGGPGMAGFGPAPSDEGITRQEARRVVRRIVPYLRPYRWSALLAVLLLMLQTSAVLAGPALVRYGIDHGLRRHDRGALDIAALLYLGVAIAALVLGRLVILIVARVGESFLRDLRVRVFDHIVALSLDFFERERTGRIVSRMTSDIDALQELVSQGLVLFVTNGLLFVGAVGALVAMSPLLAACTLVVVPGVVVATIWFRRESNRAYLAVRESVGQTLSTLQEGLAGVRVVQAFARERAFATRFGVVNEEQFSANLRTVSLSARYFPVIELAGVVTQAVILGVGGLLVARGSVTVGTVIAFLLYLGNVFEPIQQLSQLFNTVQAAGAALAKLFGLLDERPSVAERPGAVDLPERGELVADDISFAYGDGPDVLHDVSLRLAPGERLALVGPTGAGKSTLAKLIARFYDPRTGGVRFGDVDLRDATLQSLRERIVVVPQEGFLFAGTIRDNIRVGRPEAADGDVETAVAALGLSERFALLPDGLDTEVRERGSALSAGERQLVSLARAALADPGVLVLDEATSNLDPGTERAVEQALERLMEGRSVVVIAHRLSTAARANRVIVVDGGGVVEEGTHERLITREGPYAALFASWTGAASSEAEATGTSAADAAG